MTKKMPLKYLVRTVDFSPERSENVEALRLAIPDLDVLVDTGRDSYKSFAAACALINKTGGVLLEDDIALCSNFCERLERIVAEKGPDNVFNFFERPKSYFKTGYVGGSNFLWMQCVYLPPLLPLKIASYYDEFREKEPEKHRGMATDCLINYGLRKERIKYWRIRPCLVQHLAFKSVIGPRPVNRQTLYFIDDLTRKGIDYDNLQPAE